MHETTMGHNVYSHEIQRYRPCHSLKRLLIMSLLYTFNRIFNIIVYVQAINNLNRDELDSQGLLDWSGACKINSAVELGLRVTSSKWFLAGPGYLCSLC